MTKKEESILEMLGLVTKVIDDSQSLFTATPKIIVYNNRLKELRTDIKLKEGQLKSSTGGKTEAKHATMDDMINQTIIVAGSIYSYASDNNLTELEVAFDLEETDFVHVRLADIPVKCKTVLEKADELADKLGDHGTSTEEREKLRDYISQYSETESAQGDGFIYKGSARYIMTDDFFKIDKTLKSMDKLLKKFEKASPDFFAKYATAKIVRDKPGGKKKTNTASSGDDKPSENTTPPATPSA